MSITIYGASDDLVEIDADGPALGIDELPTDDAVIEIRSQADEAVGLNVRCWYADDGVWAVAVWQHGEKPLPWPVALATYDNGRSDPYSVQVTIDCPDDVTATWRDAPDDDDE